MDHHSISGGGLSARILAEGAELCSVVAPDGTELLWQAGPAWPKHAPVLFPIVGTLKDNRHRHRGRDYELFRHGFAKDRRFTWAERAADACRLVLLDDAETRSRYPFAFRFEVSYRIGAEGLDVGFRIENTGDVMLPASMGAHPAFNWPLRQGIAKSAHSLVFAAEETAPIRRVRPDGLLRREALPCPVLGRTLALHEGLFAEDAIILESPASTSLRYSAPGAPTLVFSWRNFPQLGIWMRPGGDFLCLEPWQGMSSPLDFEGALEDKPHVLLIPPGGVREASHRMAVE